MNPGVPDVRKRQLHFSWLDFKLGARMLARYPGLTIVGGLAMAFAIWVGAGTFEFLSQVVNPQLPFRHGDQIVAIRNLDVQTRDTEGRALHDLAVWRREVRTIRDIGAWRQLDRNLIVGDGRGEPVALAEINASAFRIAGVPAMLGRALLDGDEARDAPAVVVLGHDLWRARFGGDSGIVGRTIRLGATLSTVVGVMPPGFSFPIAHDLWVPFRLDPGAYPPRQGPGINVFGRLADGATLASARRELALLGQRRAVDSRETHEHLRPQVLPYAKSFLNVEGAASLGVMSSNLLLVMLLGLICLNVALLIYARTATRESEIVVRSALGASRGRIVGQLFAEALVLAAASAVVGLAAASFGLQWAFDTVVRELLDGGRLPFWFHSHLSLSTVVYAMLLALMAAAVAGVLPALKATRGLGLRLKTATSGGGGLRFGGVWTGVIVAQVALTTVFPVVAFEVRRDSRRLYNYDLNFPVERYLTARLLMDRESTPDADTSEAGFRQRFASTFTALEDRLESQTGTAVTYIDHLPRAYHGWNQIEVDEGAIAPRDARGHRPSAARIDPDYFDVLGVPILSGRRFHSGDLQPGVRSVIVNEPFVTSVLGGKNPLGRRIRYVAGESSLSPASPDDAPWHEIVGVVPDLGTINGYGRAGIYHPVTRDHAYPTYLVMRVTGDAAAFAPVLRSVATAVDPTLRLYNVAPMSGVADTEIAFYRFWFRLTLGVSAVALLLSLAGIYAVMAFTVSRRTREIGIRVALGSDPRRIIGAIFRRPLIQVAAGVAVGTLFVAALFSLGRGALPTAMQFARIGAYGLGMTLVCLLACIVPTRRALGVEPTDALRMDV
ncbi:MAG TPA: ABC transporter permease [Gemmatimonadaceae bacterium]